MVYIGYKHLKKTIDELDIVDKVEIEWQPFELNPNMPAKGQDLTEHITQKYGNTTEQHQKSKQNLIDFGNKFDFKFHFFEGMRIVNTFDAHVLLLYAKKFNKQTELKMRLTTAYFSEKKDVSKLDVLKQAIADVGLNVEDAIAKLNDENTHNNIMDKKQYWQKMGVNSVPTFIFNKTDGISGAQSIDTFKKILRKLV